MMILLIFVGLQLLDAATTLLFLGRGVAEGNPLVGALLGAGGHPALTLAGVKAAACFLGWLAWKSRRHRLLRLANVFFAMCVVWNVAAALWGGHHKAQAQPKLARASCARRADDERRSSAPRQIVAACDDLKRV